MLYIRPTPISALYCWYVESRHLEQSEASTHGEGASSGMVTLHQMAAASFGQAGASATSVVYLGALLRVSGFVKITVQPNRGISDLCRLSSNSSCLPPSHESGWHARKRTAAVRGATCPSAQCKCRCSVCGN